MTVARPARRSPVFLVAWAAAVLAAASAFHLLIARAAVEGQRDRLLRGKAGEATLLLRHLARTAVLPLLADDAPALAALVRKTPSEEGYLYAVVVDRDGVVRAHTDAENIGRRYVLPAGAKGLAQEGAVGRFSYVLSSGVKVLHLTMPIEIRNRVVGAVHAGFSLDVLGRGAEAAAAALRRSLLALWAVAAAGIAVLAAAFFIGSASAERAGSRNAPGGEPVYRVKDLQPSPAAVERGDKPPDGAGSSPEGFSVLKKALSLVGYPAERSANGERRESAPSPRIARNQATVLFAGVRDFHGYADDRIAEEMLADLPRYFAIAEETVAAHGGRIDRVVGDSIAAVFGGGAFLPDHTMRAVRAALAMQKAFRETGEGESSLLRHVGIGISSGVVLVCETPAPSRPGTITIGESFKSADSLSMLAGPGEIVIGREVYQFLGYAVSVEPLPPRETLNRTGSWENFRLQDSLRRGA